MLCIACLVTHSWGETWGIDSHVCELTSDLGSLVPLGAGRGPSVRVPKWFAVSCARCARLVRGLWLLVAVGLAVQRLSAADVGAQASRCSAH